MFHRNIKLAIAALIIISGIWQFTEGNIGNGIFLILLSAIPIFLYFKNEFILLAFLKNIFSPNYYCLALAWLLFTLTSNYLDFLPLSIFL